MEEAAEGGGPPIRCWTSGLRSTIAGFLGAKSRSPCPRVVLFGLSLYTGMALPLCNAGVLSDSGETEEDLDVRLFPGLRDRLLRVSGSGFTTRGVDSADLISFTVDAHISFGEGIRRRDCTSLPE